MAQQVKGSDVVTAVAWVRSLAQELLHAVGVAKKNSATAYIYHPLLVLYIEPAFSFFLSFFLSFFFFFLMATPAAHRSS